MKISWRCQGAALACALAGCAHSSPPPTDAASAESARREERQKIMREYWYDHTLAPGRETEPAPPPRIAYPAGAYSGVNYGPRLASDPAMAEPVR
jgi:hypothetical protein